MAINQFLEFDTAKSDIQTDEQYAADSQRVNGIATGMARSEFHNKMYRQFSVMNSAIGDWLVSKGQNANDSDKAALAAALTTAFSTYLQTAPDVVISETTRLLYGLAAGAVNANVDKVLQKLKTHTVVSITASQSWTVPLSVNNIDVFLVGGGGGGGGAYGGLQVGGGGGAGGQCLYVPNIAVTPSSSINCTIGAGGYGGVVTVYNAETQGEAGGKTSFGSYSAIGGGGGGLPDRGRGGGNGFSGGGGAYGGKGGTEGSNGGLPHGVTGGAGLGILATNIYLPIVCVCPMTGIIYGGGGGAGGATGGDGGDSSAGSGGINSTTGTSGNSAPANRGGGGGGGGCQTVSPYMGRNGGNGGSGVIIIGYYA